jgi:hypothetical protein
MPRNLYNGQSKTEGLVSEAQRCVSGVAFSGAPSANPSVTRLAPNQQRSVATHDNPDADQYRGGPSDWAAGREDGDENISTKLLGTPPGQGQGLGHFIDPSDAPFTQTNFDSETGSAGDRQAPQAYSIDDMDVSSSSRQGLEFGVGEGASGGRFATFPVKNAGRGAVPPTDDRPMLGDGNRPEKGRRSSYGASIDQAYGEPSVPIQGPVKNDRKVTFDDPLPAYEEIRTPTFSHPPGSAGFNTGGPSPGPSYDAPHTHQRSFTSGSTGLENPWSDTDSMGHQRSDSENSAQLAYMASEESLVKNSRHVRFGGPDDGDGDDGEFSLFK